MDQNELAERAKLYAGNVDSARWALADLALEAKRASVKDWPDVIGKVVRRRPRTIREWALVADFHQATGHIDGLDFSFWAIALRFADKVAAETIVELMHTARDEGVGVEEFEAELRALAGTPEPDPAKRWRKFAEKLYGEIDSYVPAVAEHLRQAAVSLEGAASALATYVSDDAHADAMADEALAEAQDDTWDETAELVEAEMEI